MKTLLNKNLLMACIAAFMLFVVSCKKDDPTTTTTTGETSAESNTALQSTASSMGDEAALIINSEGVKTVSSFSSFSAKSDVFQKMSNKNLSTQLIEKVKGIILYSCRIKTNKVTAYNKTNSSSGHFDFAANVGTYSWNATDNKWDAVKGGNSIILKFPSDSTKKTNDATLTLSAYDEALVQVTNGGNDTTYLPTKIEATLLVNTAKIASLSYAAKWTVANDQIMPLTLNATLYVKPYTLTVKFDNAGTTVSGSVTLSKDGKTILGIGGSVTFVDATQKEVSKINNAYIEYKEIKLQGSANIQALLKDTAQYKDMDKLVAAINTHIPVEIYHNNYLIGKIIAVKKTSGTGGDELDIIIKFNDGTTKRAEEYLKPIADKISKEMDSMKK